MRSMVDVCSHPLLAPWDDQHGLATSAAASREAGQTHQECISLDGLCCVCFHGNTTS